MANFEVGDEVFLKSGGERMTVEEIDGDSISCVWFKNKVVERNCFPAATLKKAATPEEVSAAMGRLGARLG